VDEEKIRQMVLRVLHRTLGIEKKGSQAPSPMSAKKEEYTFLKKPSSLAKRSVSSTISSTTPKQAKQRDASFSLQGKTRNYGSQNPSRGTRQIVAIGADHGGFEMKEQLKNALSQEGYSFIDCGTDSKEAVDYPDFAFAVGQLVAQGKAWRGIVIDGAGIGSCMAVNKIPGALAAMCYDYASAVNSREHNDANVLTLGAGLLGPSLALQIAKVWLATPHAGGRHEKRVNKIRDIERRFLK